MNVLIIRPDAIGDYILFRNCLRFVRLSTKYRHARITILGNPAWRNLAETFDSDYADEWLWQATPQNLFRSSSENLLPAAVWKPRVKARQAPIRQMIADRHFDEILIPQAFANRLLETLADGLSQKIIKGWEIDSGGEPFVFLRNRRITSALTGEHCNVNLNLSLPDPPKRGNNIILFASASHWTRQWPFYDALAQLITAQTPYSVIVEGRPDTPKRTLSDFALHLATAKAVVSNDTMTLHLAAALGIPVIGITNGFSGKNDFWPYPSILDKQIEIISPRTARHMNLAGPFGLALNQILDYRSICSIKPTLVFNRLKAVL